MDVSVIIVNFNTKQLTSNAIQSVFDKTNGIDYEIIVIDNASNDSSVEYLQLKFGNKIKIIESGSNLGFGCANNIGFRQSQGKYIFLLNSDTELINNAIKIFFDYMENKQSVGICGGNLFNGNNNPTESFTMYDYRLVYYFFWRYMELISNIISCFTNKKFYYRFNYTDFPKKVGYISGADMFIRKECLDKTGFFDEKIFMYGDDSDLCFRFQKNKFDVMSVPQAKITHLEYKSNNNLLQKWDNSLTGTYYMNFKYYGKNTFFIYLDMQFTLFRKFAKYFLFCDYSMMKNYFYILKLDRKIYKKLKNKYYK